MRYLLASLLAVVLVGGMLLFQNQMMAQIVLWEEAETVLSLPQQLLCRAAFSISSYWYVMATVIVIGCFGMAAVFPRRSPAKQGSS